MIGEKLIELRKKNNLNQSDVCDCLKIKRSTYSGYETNSANPSIETIIKLAKFFKVSTDYLLGYKVDDKDKVKQVLIEQGLLNREI